MRSASETSNSNYELAEVLAASFTEQGRSLLDLVDAGTVMLVFLRHFGCSYCRQSISDVAAVAQQLETRGVRPVFVHLGSPERAQPYFDYYGLHKVDRISDPEAALYTSKPFALPKQHPLTHFLLPRNWKGWLTEGLFKYGIGMIHEDSHQMPGIFVLRDRSIVNSFRFQLISDQPDYLALIS